MTNKEPIFTCLRCHQTLKLNNFAIKLWDGSYHRKVICGCHLGAICDYILIPDDTVMTCHCCGKELPLSAYDVDKQTSLVKKYCKECRKVEAINYYKNHTEIYNQRAVEWRQNNPEGWKAIHRRNFKKNHKNWKKYKHKQ